MAGNNIEPGKHHVSKTYIALTVIRTIWLVILLIIVGGLQILSDLQGLYQYASAIKILPFIMIGAALLLLGIVVLFSWISYKRLTWEITDEELHIYKGIIVRKKSHIPFRRIHSVDINAKVLDRIFGVVTVKLDTAAGSAKSEDAKIPALHLSTAEILRTEIFRRKSINENKDSAETATGGGNILTDLERENSRIRGVYAGADQNITPEAEYRLTTKELILYCISNGKAFAIILTVLLFMTQMMDILEVFNIDADKLTENTVNQVVSMGPIIIAVIIIIAMILSMIVSFITRALTYGNFVVRRYGARVEVSTGLIQKKSTGVAVERIQTLKIQQGLLQRILGYAEVSIETASGFGKSGGNDQDTNPGVVLHPFIKKDRIEDFMNKMLNEFSDRPEEMEALSKIAMRRSMVRYGLFTLILVIIPFNLIWYLIRNTEIREGVDPGIIALVDKFDIGLSAGLFVLMVIIGWGAWRGRAYAQNARYLAIRKGVISRIRIFVPKIKIQFAHVAQNPFQKRVSLVTLKANTAALGSSFQSIKDVGEDIGNEYLDWIENKRTK